MMKTTARRRSPSTQYQRTADVRQFALPIVVVALAVSLLLIAPGALPDKLMALAAGVCPQRPSHSYALGGTLLPLEARMLGIFAGMWTVMALVALARGRGLVIPTPRRFAVLLSPVALMAVDGLNATAHDLGFGALYLPDNAVRLATGLAGGAAMALLFLPVAAQSVALADDRDLKRRDYALLLVAMVALWLAPVAGWPWAYLPLAFAAIAGLVLTAALLNLLLIAGLLGRHWAVELGAVSCVLAILELLALGQLRHAVLDALPML